MERTKKPPVKRASEELLREAAALSDRVAKQAERATALFKRAVEEVGCHGRAAIRAYAVTCALNTATQYLDDLEREGRRAKD